MLRATQWTLRAILNIVDTKDYVVDVKGYIMDAKGHRVDV